MAKRGSNDTDKQLKTLSKRHPLVALVLAITIALATTVSANIDARRYAVPDVTGEASVSLTEWDESLAPNYVLKVGNAQIDRELTSTPVTETDAYGRPSTASARVDISMVEEGSARERDDLPDPIGWPKNFECDVVTPDGDTYHGWFWNRSHLVAKSLGGPDTRDNLVSGTRMQNVGANVHPGGMAYAETQVRDFLRAHPSETVDYVATPVYVGVELIPRSVILDVRSSDGSIDERLVVFNAQKGYAIDYMTGEVTKCASDAATGVLETILRYLSSLAEVL